MHLACFLGGQNLSSLRTSVSVHELFSCVLYSRGLHGRVVVQARLHHLDQVGDVGDDDIRILGPAGTVRRGTWTLAGN